MCWPIFLFPRLLAPAAQNRGHLVTDRFILQHTSHPLLSKLTAQEGKFHLFLLVHLNLLLIFFLPRGSWVLYSVILKLLIPQGQRVKDTVLLTPLPWNVFQFHSGSEMPRRLWLLWHLLSDDLFLKQKIMLKNKWTPSWSGGGYNPGLLFFALWDTGHFK